MHSATKHLALLAVAVFACSAVGAQPTLYWSDVTKNKIQRLDLAQSVVEDVVVAPLANPGNMAVDFEMGHMYWSSLGRQMIVRANMDGSDLRQIHAGRLVALDTEDRKMYVLLDSTLHRMNLDGTEGEVLFELTKEVGAPNFPTSRSVVIDLEAEKVYWYCDLWLICRANLDGSEQGPFVDWGGFGLFIDTVGGRLFMESALYHELAVVNLDGSGFEVISDVHGHVSDMAVDGEHGKVYWAESPGIRRSNLDGSDLEDLILLDDGPSGITLDASNDVLLWNSGNGVWRSGLDGSNIEQLVASNIEIPNSIRVDHAGGHVYWSDGGSIGRFDFDGLHEEILIDGLAHDIGEFAIDPQAGFLYWVLNRTVSSGNIQRSRLDGSDIENVVYLPEPHLPQALEVDVENERMFWTSIWRGIFTARLDGTETTQIVSGGPFEDLAIDVDHERIYWLDRSERGSQLGWTSMDGSVSEVLHEGTEQEWGALALDPVNEYVYWSRNGEYWSTDGEIWRGSLTGGSEMELVASGLGEVSWLTICFEATSTGVAAEEVPNRFDLAQNYPNPFNPSTTISYALPEATYVTLTVVDLLGRPVRVLASGMKPVGHYEVSFDATGLPSGVYFYRLEARSFTETRSMVVLR